MRRSTFPDALRAVVGSDHVLEAEVTDDLRRYTTDWTGRFVGTASVVVRPGCHDEVSEVVRLCRQHGRSIVPQGGNTGLVGGSVPLHGEVLVSLTRLRAIGPVDPVARQVTVGAGVTLAEVQEAAERAGLRYPVDFGARDSATVGGMIATNAGGIGVFRFGSTRHHVRGTTAVLGDGSTVSHMTGLLKDNTGYDLAGLLCGSEGTLGIVTSAILGLVPGAGHMTSVLLGCRDLDAAVSLVAGVSGPELEAAEVMLADGVTLVERTVGVTCPVEAPVLVLVDVNADERRTEELLVRLCGADGVLESAIATDDAGRRRLWRLRDEHTPAISTLGPPLKLDVTLPLARLSDFVAAIATAVEDVGRLFVFGHLGDGNLHVNVSGLAAGQLSDVEESVLRAVQARGGSISAEHGIGTAKKKYLHLSRSVAEIEAMRSIKRALDPDGILNPHVLLPE